VHGRHFPLTPAKSVHSRISIGPADRFTSRVLDTGAANEPAPAQIMWEELPPESTPQLA